MLNCIVSIISSTGNGGAICIENTQLSISINDTTFYKCITSNGIGGAIYFFSKLNTGLFRICVFGCEATTRQFALLYIENDQI